MPVVIEDLVTPEPEPPRRETLRPPENPADNLWAAELDGGDLAPEYYAAKSEVEDAELFGVWNAIQHDGVLGR